MHSVFKRQVCPATASSFCYKAESINENDDGNDEKWVPKDMESDSDSPDFDDLYLQKVSS